MEILLEIIGEFLMALIPFGRHRSLDLKLLGAALAATGLLAGFLLWQKEWLAGAVFLLLTLCFAVWLKKIWNKSEY